MNLSEQQELLVLIGKASRLRGKWLSASRETRHFGEALVAAAMDKVDLQPAATQYHAARCESDCLGYAMREAMREMNAKNTSLPPKAVHYLMANWRKIAKIRTDLAEAAAKV